MQTKLVVGFLLLICFTASAFVLAEALDANGSMNSTNITIEQVIAVPSGVFIDQNPVVATIKDRIECAGQLPGDVAAARTSENCITSGYIINNQDELNITGYNCSVADDGKTYITCDSIYDGNGDGICTSGESCVQFGIVGGYITRLERNSQDQWVEQDKSFFTRRPEVVPAVAK